MASLELSPLSEHLDAEEIELVNGAITELGENELELDESIDPVVIDRDLDDDSFADFMDRLEANDAAADIYVPGDFEDVIDISGYRVGSSHALLLILEAVKGDFFVDEDEEQDDDEEIDFEAMDEPDEEVSQPEDASMELKDEEMRHLWKLMYRGAKTSVTRKVCLFVHI
ncbi:MAG TPA: hypothetical protein VFG83_03985 [Kofleriaceae bacterium]|nr:hypothetical protein [Kofleriaceae bacterium]